MNRLIASRQISFFIHMLESSNLKEDEVRKRLFKEMHRVLKPDGQLIMVESNLREVFQNKSFEQIVDKLKTELSVADFKKVHILPPLTFQKRSYISKFMRSSHGVLDPKGIDINFHGISISAEK